MFYLRPAVVGTINSQPSDFSEILEFSRRFIECARCVFTPGDFVTVQKNENGVVKGEKRGEKVDIALDGFFDLRGVGKEERGDFLEVRFSGCQIFGKRRFSGTSRKSNIQKI